MIIVIINRMQLPGGAVGICVCIALLAGCGGGGGGTTGAGSQAGGQEASSAAGEGGSAAAEGAGKQGNGATGETQGGGEGKESASGDSKAAFVKQLDAICASGSGQIGSEVQVYAEKVGLNGLPKKAQAIVDNAVVPNLERELGEIEAQTPPAEAEQATEAITSAIHDLIAAAKADPRAFMVAGEAVLKAEQIAHRNGFSQCGGI